LIVGVHAGMTEHVLPADGGGPTGRTDAANDRPPISDT